MHWHRQRILEVLSQHPDGLAAEVLVSRAGQPSDRAALLKTVRRMGTEGLVIMEGRQHGSTIASALVRRPSPTPAGDLENQTAQRRAISKAEQAYNQRLSGQ
jgi:hypothetical protein